MKIKSILLMIVILLTFITKTYATKTIPEYNFYIKESSSIGKEEIIPLLIGNSIDDKLLESGKIAPGTEGAFTINVNISKNIRTKYSIKFGKFSKKLPENLKFYYDGKEVNLNTFTLNDEKISSKGRYSFYWKWEYEGVDEIDYKDSNLGDIKFDIVLLIDYAKIAETLPRSGDI